MIEICLGSSHKKAKVKFKKGNLNIYRTWKSWKSYGTRKYLKTGLQALHQKQTLIRPLVQRYVYIVSGAKLNILGRGYIRDWISGFLKV